MTASILMIRIFRLDSWVDFYGNSNSTPKLNPVIISGFTIFHENELGFPFL